jgi:transcriptional regulator with XRE-family HTH domain
MRKTAAPAQCRAARALLGWTQAKLAARAAVARKTIAEFEIGARQLRFRTRRDITTALEAGGLVFLWDSDGPHAGGIGVWRSNAPPAGMADGED